MKASTFIHKEYWSTSNLYFYPQPLGPPQDPLFIFKCGFGDLVSYGLGKNKKAAKNRSAYMMLRKLNEHVEIENVKTNLCNLDRWVGDKTAANVRDVVQLNENAVSVLEALDRIRFERTLKFTEAARDIGWVGWRTIALKEKE